MIESTFSSLLYFHKSIDQVMHKEDQKHQSPNLYQKLNLLQTLSIEKIYQQLWIKIFFDILPFQSYKSLKYNTILKPIESLEQILKHKHRFSQDNKYLYIALLKLKLLLKNEMNPPILSFYFFSLTFSIHPQDVIKNIFQLPNNNSKIYITTPTMIKIIPNASIPPDEPKIASANFPPVNARNPNTISNAGTPYANTFTIILPFDISIHRYLVTFIDLKCLWVSLSSKETFVFDTPGKDTRLSFFFNSEFYVCKSLNGEWLITNCHSHYLRLICFHQTMRPFLMGVVYCL